ncbi:MAG: hypothetical protein ABIW50_04375 [Candidatus Limnocylindria bacterium]
MTRPTITALVVLVGLLLLADLLVVNSALQDVAGVVVDAAILVAAGAALAAGASLVTRRLGDLWRRRGDPIGALLVVAGVAAMLVAGMRPGSSGSDDPAVQWLLAALLIPIGATLFGLLFVSTVAAARRSVAGGSREAVVLVTATTITVLLLLPLAGSIGSWLSDASGWMLGTAVASVFRGLLIGIALLGAVYAARTMLGIGSADE